MTGQSIVDDARAHLKVWRSLPFPPEIVASKMWDDNTADISTVLEANTAEEVVAGISSKGPISAAIRTDSPNWQQRCDDTLRWLEKFGRPLGSFPAYIQESEFIWPEAVAVVEGRRLSMAFLYHLCIAAQIEKTAGKVGSVFELGSGYGGLARILKLLNPGAKIVLCDLPTTLYFCYVYLRRHFPNATFEVIERAGQSRGSADFTFVPAPLARELAGSTFDLVANTSSLSEMTQDAADWYLHLIQNDMKVDYLYHLNRLGTPEALGNACATSYGLDKHWEVLTWHWQNAGSFNLVTYPETPALLNLIARRIPEQIRSDVIYAAMARPLRARLAALNAPAPVPTPPEPEKSSFWRKAPPPIVVAPPPEAPKQPSDELLSAMWDLIRIERRPADIAAFLDVIRPLQWREVEYYDSLLKKGASRS